MGILLAAVVIGLIPAFVAQSKGRSFVAWWLYGAALFIIALPHAILLTPGAGYGSRKCPFCAELIKAEARVCRYCSRDLPALAEATEVPARVLECPKCKAAVAEEATECPACGVRFFECPECKANVDAVADKCPSCGTQFEPGPAEDPSPTRPDSRPGRERGLEEWYVRLYRTTRGMSEPEARETVRAMIQKAKDDAHREGTNTWPAQMGDVMLAQAATDEKAKTLVMKKQREGVTDEDIRAWWNLPDLERRLLLLSSEQVRIAMFIDGLKKGMEEEAAAVRMRKYFPIFGDPDDTSHTSGDDRPLPVELKLRITAWSEKMAKDDSGGYKAALEASSSYNALVRRQLLGRL